MKVLIKTIYKITSIKKCVVYLQCIINLLFFDRSGEPLLSYIQYSTRWFKYDQA